MEKSLILNIVGLVERMLAYLAKSANPRNAQIIAERYGLNGESPEGLTLEAIGKMHGGITRERVRQIEQHSFGVLKKFPFSEDDIGLFKEIEKKIESLGFVVCEELLLKEYSNNRFVQNQISFCLPLYPTFSFLKEDDECRSCWSINNQLALTVSKALSDVRFSLEESVVLTEEKITEIFSVFLGEATLLGNEKNLLRWLSISKKLAKNMFNEWGLANSPLISPHSVADLAYIVMEKNGKPLHFSSIASEIKKQLKKDVDMRTCHNGVILDNRFVLVGRGLYGLRKWGYDDGFTIDVIKEVLKESPGLTKKEIVQQVKKIRFVKDSTIVVMLNRHKTECFDVTDAGLFKLKEEKKEGLPV